MIKELRYYFRSPRRGLMKTRRFVVGGGWGLCDVAVRGREENDYRKRKRYLARVPDINSRLRRNFDETEKPDSSN